MNGYVLVLTVGEVDMFAVFDMSCILCLSFPIARTTDPTTMAKSMTPRKTPAPIIMVRWCPRGRLLATASTRRRPAGVSFVSVDVDDGTIGDDDGAAVDVGVLEEDDALEDWKQLLDRETPLKLAWFTLTAATMF